MRNVVSNQGRRRRLRLIKSIEEWSAKQARSAVTALTIASDAESARLDLDAIRRQLILECRVNVSSYLRVEHDGVAPMDVVMDRPYLLIGRDPACDLRLDHPDVKPHHFYLQWIEGRLFCCDVGPRSSLYPDENSGPIGQWIDDRATPIGPFRLTLVSNKDQFAHGRPDQVEGTSVVHTATNSSTDIPLLVPAEKTPLERSARLSVEYPLLALQFDGVEQNDNVWPVNRILTMIGRGPQCKLRLNHKNMAYVQACLLRTLNGCWLIDLAKDGTTSVNSREVSISPVDVGDVLQLGVFQVEVVTMAIPAVLPNMGCDREMPDNPVKNREPANKNRRARERTLFPFNFARSSRVDTSPLADGSDSVVGKAALPQASSTIEPMRTETQVNEATLAEFVQQQQQQLAALKRQLDALQQIEDAADGESGSQRMHETLGKPVSETLECYESMQESLAKLMQSVSR